MGIRSARTRWRRLDMGPARPNRRLRARTRRAARIRRTMPMPVKFKETEIGGVLEVACGPLRNDRGFFSETYSQAMWAAAKLSEDFKIAMKSRPSCYPHATMSPTSARDNAIHTRKRPPHNGFHTSRRRPAISHLLPCQGNGQRTSRITKSGWSTNPFSRNRSRSCHGPYPKTPALTTLTARPRPSS